MLAEKKPFLNLVFSFRAPVLTSSMNKMGATPGWGGSLILAARTLGDQYPWWTEQCCPQLIPGLSSCWTRPWCNQSVCFLPYTYRCSLDYSSMFLISSIFSVIVSMCWACDRSSEMCIQDLEAVESLLHHPFGRLMDPQFSPSHVNNQLLGLAVVESKIVLATLDQNFNLSPVLWLITHYSSNNDGIISEFKNLKIMLALCLAT